MKIWLICYDVSDNKRRYHISRLLEGYGERIQYSAFECRLSTSHFNQLRNALNRFVTEEDKLNYYSVCQWCADKRHAQGSGLLSRAQHYYVA